MKLDVGAGYSPKEGYTSVDKFTPADYKADILKLPFEDNSIEEIYTSHVLEHLAKKDVPLALSEIYRVLQHEGIFTIIVPDLLWCMNNFLNSLDHYGFPLDVIYGNQEHEGEFHKTGFTMDILKVLITNAGLKITKLEFITDHDVQSIVSEGVKNGTGSL